MPMFLSLSPSLPPALPKINKYIYLGEDLKKRQSLVPGTPPASPSPQLGRAYANPNPCSPALLSSPPVGAGKEGDSGEEGRKDNSGLLQDLPQMVPRNKPQAQRPPEEGTYLAGGSCGVSGRGMAAAFSRAGLLLRRLGEASAERRGAGLEFWGSNSSSGMTSSQRAPRKPERHTQSWGRLQEPRFWHGGWHTAGETGGGVRAGAQRPAPTCQKGPWPVLLGLLHSSRKPTAGPGGSLAPLLLPLHPQASG